MVLVFAAPAGPFSQPRGVIGGQCIAAIVGVGCRVWVSDTLGDQGPALAVPLSVTITYLLMHLTRTINPPGGGTAAIAVVPSPTIRALGWGLVVPVFLWSCVFVFVACLFINLLPSQRYPKFWFVGKSAAGKPALKQPEESSTRPQIGAVTAASMERDVRQDVVSVV